MPTSGVLRRRQADALAQAPAMAPGSIPTPSINETISIITHVSFSGFSPSLVIVSGPYMQQFVADVDGVSVASSSFDMPCRPATGDLSIYSGLMNQGDVFMLDYAVTNDEPIYFYSPLGMDCVNGHVGATNPSSSNTLADYTAAAHIYGMPGISPPAPLGGSLQAAPQAQTLASWVQYSAAFSSQSLQYLMAPMATVLLVGLIALGTGLGIAYYYLVEWSRRRRGVADLDRLEPPFPAMDSFNANARRSGNTPPAIAAFQSPRPIARTLAYLHRKPIPTSYGKGSSMVFDGFVDGGQSRFSR